MKLPQSFLFLQAILWFVLAGIHFAQYQQWLIPLLLILDGVGFLAFAFLFPKHTIFRILAAAYLAANILLTVSDQMGVWDYLVLALNVITIIVIVPWFWKLN
jgi:hypothetical protein